MCKKCTKRGDVDYLNNHIKNVESVKNHVLREFYSEQTKERDSFIGLINKYISNIKNIINIKTDASKNTEDGYVSWPLVLIGSVVEVEDLECNTKEALKIVPPFYDNKGNNLECASCLSPVGSALLLKKIGDKIKVNTPLGESNLVIKSIELPSV